METVHEKVAEKTLNTIEVSGTSGSKGKVKRNTSINQNSVKKVVNGMISTQSVSGPLRLKNDSALKLRHPTGGATSSAVKERGGLSTTTSANKH